MAGGVCAREREGQLKDVPLEMGWPWVWQLAEEEKGIRVRIRVRIRR